MKITGKRGTKRTIHHGRLARRAVLAICLLLILFVGGVAQAGSGGVVKLPGSSKPPKSGLRVTVDTTWVSGPGYRPVRIEIASTAGPVLADRNLFVELTPNDWGGRSGRSGGLSAGMPIEISEGSAAAVATLLVPQYYHWQSIAVDVYEDGEQIKELSGAGLPVSDRNEWSELMPKVLVIHSDAPMPEDRTRRIRRGRADSSRTGSSLPERDLPDLRSWGEVTEWTTTDRAASAGEPRDADILAVVNKSSRLELLPPDRLPDNWVGLTSVDVIMISMDDLSDLKQKSPDKFRAIRTAAATGSVLCVWDVGDEFERLESLEELLELNPLPHDGVSPTPFCGWRAPDPKTFFDPVPVPDQAVVGMQDVESIKEDGWVLAADGERLIRSAIPKAPPVYRPPFRFRPLGLGTVIGIAAEDPFPGRTAQWYWLLRSAPDRQWQWNRRHGMSVNRANEDFWNFLIPGVGMAPVTFFRVLITIFVVVIGPVNYLLLRRWGRLHLLLVTVPAGALLVVTGLFLYAFLADGLGVRARVRSFTLLDQKRGESISWSRQMYYAGLAPSHGLAFPSTSAVYPLVPVPADELEPYRGGRGRHVNWDDQQRLTGGWFRSRTITQLMVVQADRSEIGLTVRPGNIADEPPEVTNRLGGRIMQLCLSDEEGRCFFAEDVADGEVFRPKPVSPGRREIVFGSTPSRNRLKPPEDFDLARYSGTYRRNRWQYAGPYGLPDQTPPPSTSTSVLEHHLGAVVKGGQSLDKRNYLAVVERCETVPLGVRAREELGYHVIKGSW